MSYRRRNQPSAFPRIVFLLLLVGIVSAGGYAFIPGVQRRAQTLLARVTAHAPGQTDSQSATTNLDPRFVVSLPTMVPLDQIPSPDVPARDFLNAWQAGKYADMYALLSKKSQANQSAQAFADWYSSLTAEATITKITPEITSVPMIPPNAGNGASVQVPFTVQFDTIRVGTFQENNSVSLILEGGQWKVDWQPSLFFHDLAPNDTVRLFPLNPRRGSILDRKGRYLATMGFQETIGVVPGKLGTPQEEQQTLTIIGQYLHKTPAELQKIYAGQPKDWFIPLGDVSGSLETELHQKLDPLPGVVLQRKPIRVYPQGDVAAHVVGYVGHITPAELKTYAAKGYTVDDYVGREGVEQWADAQLAGQRGGILAIVAQTGEVIKVIARRDAVPGNDVVLSIDLDIQKEAEKVLGTLDGSIIVMDPQDNSVLALASYPRFDPNKFVTGFTPAEWQALNTSPDHPFQDRPVESIYPTGSIFKPITMSAGMEKLGYTVNSMFDCSYWWNGPGGLHLHNWEVQGHLNLVQSLTGSCDPTFYTIGLAIYNKDPNILPIMARAFGLGQKTGINGVQEAAGLVPDPAWKEKTLHQPWYPGDSVILAIGQGYLEASPIQMANAYSAIANNGLRRSPILVQKIVDPQGKVVKTYTAPTLGHLPISTTTLQAIQAGMLGTTSTPLGTAYYAFQTYKHPMEVKTGSAENQNVLAHAWFVGYTPPQNPKYLIQVMVEGRGESMQIASPMARQLMDYLWPNNQAQPLSY